MPVVRQFENGRLRRSRSRLRRRRAQYTLGVIANAFGVSSQFNEISERFASHVRVYVAIYCR